MHHVCQQFESWAPYNEDINNYWTWVVQLKINKESIAAMHSNICHALYLQ